MDGSKYADIVSNLVQEIAQKGEEIPEKYLLREDVISPAIDASPTLWEETLLIDFSLLSPSDSLAHQKELAKLNFALKHWGCFQVINHGVTSLFLDELLDVTKQFFALPLKKRLKCSIPGQHHRGYGNAAKFSGNKPINWCDQLYLTVYPQDQCKLELWPQNLQNFREILQEYTLKIRMLYEGILKAMARSLDLKEDSFLNQHDDERGRIATKFSLYPRCSRPDRVMGARPHIDPSTMTVLLPDNKVPDGLHIQKHDQWFKVPVKPGALFINLGDCGQVMSNDIFKSVVHRVVTNSQLERVSVTAFCVPGPKCEIGPINELISTNQPQIYKKVDLQTYQKVLVETLTLDARVLDYLKI